MTREEIVAYARRDWAAVAAAKSAFWREEKGRISADEIYRRIHGFRRHLEQFHPDWPTNADREADLRAHLELSRKLGAIRGRSGS